MFRKKAPPKTTSKQLDNTNTSPNKKATSNFQEFDQGDYHTAVNRFGVFALDYNTRHRPAVRITLEGGVHEPKVVEFIRHRCGDGDIVQAGAFFGDHITALSAQLPKNSTIWAFEPNPRSFFLAQRTIALNNMRNVNLFNCVLDDKAGTVELVVEGVAGRQLGGLSHVVGSGHVDDEKLGRTVLVDAMTLDEVVPMDRTVSIIQLDVEGHEIKALSGARELISRCKPILILEFVKDTSDLDKLFPDAGYRPVGQFGLDTVFLPADRFC